MARESVLNVLEQSVNGDNKLILGGSLQTTGGLSNLKSRSFVLSVTDIATAGSVWFVPGIQGTVTRIISVIDAFGFGTAILSFRIGGVSITDADITIDMLSAGTIDESFPTGNNVITANDTIEVVKNGGASGTVNSTLSFQIILS